MFDFILLGELPEVRLAMPPQLSASLQTKSLIKECAVAYRLEGIREERGIISARLCLDHQYILDSGARTPQETVSIRLTFRRTQDDWVCEVEPDR